MARPSLLDVWRSCTQRLSVSFLAFRLFSSGFKLKSGNEGLLSMSQSREDFQQSWRHSVGPMKKQGEVFRHVKDVS